jgi:hypothetical protein
MISTPAAVRLLRARLPRRALVAGLALSIALHVALSFWPADDDAQPDTLPLQASIVEMPPPPMPVAAAPVKARPLSRASSSLRTASTSMWQRFQPGKTPMTPQQMITSICMSGTTHPCMTYQRVLCSAAGVHMGSGLAHSADRL